jgi:hypothetical protein
MSHIFTRKDDPNPRICNHGWMITTIWTCTDCGLEIHAGNHSLVYVEESCVSQGPDYATCEGYKLSKVRDIMES